MNMKAKRMRTSYIKHEVYDRLSVSEARFMCFSYSSQHHFLYLQLGSIYLFIYSEVILARHRFPVSDQDQ